MKELPLDNQRPIVVAATFTGDPLRDPIEFWIRELRLPARVEFAPYHQVLQQLIDPASLFHRNRDGLNVVLLRLEDLRRVREGERELAVSGPDAESEVEANLRNYLTALKSAARGSGTPYMVCVTGPVLGTRPEFLDRMEQLIVAELTGLTRVQLTTARVLADTYSIGDYYDRQADQMGHVPYTPQYFAALGTAICRTFDALTRAPYKVLVLDCDQTLWSGVVGDDGPAGIRVDSSRLKLQEFVRAQHDAGMLLCICSKNNDEDVRQVFDCNEMPLRREHITGWRINWRPKSDNLKSLAAELQLGLDSFIFMDDNPVECAEVQANCPESLVLQLPSDVSKIPSWLAQVWAFDHVNVTDEDSQRTQLYRQNRHRQEFQATFHSLADFIAGLELQIEIAKMVPEYLSRVAQLTNRTNQFNTTTLRRSEAEIQQLLVEDKFEILTVKVTDRFGDYGLVGVVVFETDSDSLNVETFLLSCRVLGKGIEHRIFAYLGGIAMERGLRFLRAQFLATARNKPARNFLEGLGAQYRTSTMGGFSVALPVDIASALQFDPGTSATVDVEHERREKAGSSGSTPRAQTRRASELALMCLDMNELLKAIESSRPWRHIATHNFRAPETPLQRQLASIWQRLLRVERIGIRDDYFELGGDSLVAVRLFSQIRNLTGEQLPLVTLFEAPTIEKLAAVISKDGWKAPWQALVAIKSSGSKPPFYCVHGVGGNVLEYYDLAKYVDDDQPFYGIQAVGLDGRQPNITVDRMATRYIEEIIALQPRGPYYLGGSSFGGLVAYEMARQLHARGQRVAFLALFDTHGPGYPQALPTTTVWQRRMNRLQRRLNLHWGNFVACEPNQRPRYVLEKATRWTNQRIQGTIERAQNASQWWQERFGSWFWPDATREVKRAGNWAAGDYIAQSYLGKVTLFRATEQPLGIVPDPTLGWGPLVKGGLEIIDTPGHHGAIVREPRAPVLASLLRKSLLKAQRAETVVLVEETA